MSTSALAALIVSASLLAQPPLHEIASEPTVFDDDDVAWIRYTSRSPVSAAMNRIWRREADKITAHEPLLANAGRERLADFLRLGPDRRATLDELARQAEADIAAAFLRLRETESDIRWEWEHDWARNASESRQTLHDFNTSRDTTIDRFISDLAPLLEEAERERLPLAVAEVERIAFAQNHANFLGVALDPVLVLEAAELEPDDAGLADMLDAYRSQAAQLLRRSEDAARRVHDANSALNEARAEEDIERIRQVFRERMLAFIETRRDIDRLNRSTLSAMIDAAAPDHAQRLLGAAERIAHPGRLRLNLEPGSELARALANDRTVRIFDVLGVCAPQSRFDVVGEPRFLRTHQLRADGAVPAVPKEVIERLAPIRERYIDDRDRILEILERFSTLPDTPYLGGRTRLQRGDLSLEFQTPIGEARVTVSGDPFGIPDDYESLDSDLIRTLIETPDGELDPDQRRIRIIIRHLRDLERRTVDAIRDALPPDLRSAIAHI